jgi:hypothetical protein
MHPPLVSRLAKSCCPYESSTLGLNIGWAKKGI